VLLGNGDGTFAPAVTGAVSQYPDAMVAGDFNSDGKVDLAVTANGVANNIPYGFVDINLSDGDGTFKPAVTFATGAQPSAAVVGDFNHDGNLDLAVTNQGDSNVGILLGNGNGTFQPQATFAAETGPDGLVVGDFNGDGNQDLAVANFYGT